MLVCCRNSSRQGRTIERHQNKKAREASLFFAQKCYQAGTDIDLTFEDKRLLWRAALFLWNRPLSATESITLWAVAKSSVALALSPANTAF